MSVAQINSLWPTLYATCVPERKQKYNVFRFDFMRKPHLRTFSEGWVDNFTVMSVTFPLTLPQTRKMLRFINVTSGVFADIYPNVTW